MTASQLLAALSDLKSKIVLGAPRSEALWKLAREVRGFAERGGTVVKRGAPAQKPDSVSLRVSRGGRTTLYRITTDAYLVGGGMACDLVVTGMSSGPAFQLSCKSGETEWGAEATLLRDGITISGEELASGAVLKLWDGDVIKVDDVSFTIIGVGEKNARVAKVASMLRRSRGARFEAMVFLCFAGLLILYGVGSFVSVAPPDRFESHSERKKTPEMAIEDLRQALRSARIDASTSITPDRSKIEVDATADTMDMATEARLRTIITAADRFSPVPIDDLSRPNASLKKAIAAVATSPLRFIVDHEGRRYRLGETFGGTWTITMIQPNVVTVSRGHVIARIDVPSLD